MISPDSRAHRARRQAETPLSALCRFPVPALCSLVRVPLEVGDAILNFQTSSNNQCELILRVLPLIEMPEGMRERIKSMCLEFKQLGAERNKIVHAEWIDSDGKLIHRVANTKDPLQFRKFMERGEYPRERVRSLDDIKKFRTNCEDLERRFDSLFYAGSDFLELFPSVN